MKHGLFYTIFSWALDRFGYHLTRNSKQKKKAEESAKAVPEKYPTTEV